MPLRGAPQDGLALARPGVYEVLVNVNGVPRDGVRARLAAVRLLLPVLSLPPGPDPQAGPAVPAPPAEPAAGVTLLYPLTDAPRRLPTVPGEQTLLTDDDLARSFAPDGRLGGLVAAYAERAPPGSAVRAATCLAVDPDLVATAAAMRQGYLVRAADGTTAPGTGAEAAGRLAGRADRDGPRRLRRRAALRRRRPRRAGPRRTSATSRGTAVTDGRTVVADTLGTPVLDGTHVARRRRARRARARRGRRRRRPAPSCSPRTRSTATGGAGPRAWCRSPERGRPPLLGGADRPAAEPGRRRGRRHGRRAPRRPASRALPVGVDRRRDQHGRRDEPAALDPGRPRPRSSSGRRPTPPADGPIVLAPPHLWTADATAARALLDAVDVLLDAGRLQPRGLADVVAAGPATPGDARRAADPLRARRPRRPAAGPGDRARTCARTSSTCSRPRCPRPASARRVDATFGPLLQAALRPRVGRLAGPPRPRRRRRRRPPRPGSGSCASRSGCSTRPAPYSLGTRDAPLLLTVANGLPVTMEVRLEHLQHHRAAGRPDPGPAVPPLGRRQVQVDAEVIRSGQFVVEATVRSPAGALLGPPSRLQVRSTAYGTITVWLTGCAGVLLVVLAARRVVRRIRGEPSRRDRVGPAAGPPAPAGRARHRGAGPGPAPVPTAPDAADHPPPDRAAAGRRRPAEPPTRPVPARPDPEPTDPPGAGPPAVRRAPAGRRSAGPAA